MYVNLQRALCDYEKDIMLWILLPFTSFQGSLRPVFLVFFFPAAYFLSASPEGKREMYAVCSVRIV